jgi:hypothetical protein
MSDKKKGVLEFKKSQLPNFIFIHSIMKAGYYLISGDGSTKEPNKITLGFGHSRLKNVSNIHISLDKNLEEFSLIKDLLKL